MNDDKTVGSGCCTPSEEIKNGKRYPGLDMGNATEKHPGASEGSDRFTGRKTGGSNPVGVEDADGDPIGEETKMINPDVNSMNSRG